MRRKLQIFIIAAQSLTLAAASNPGIVNLALSKAIETNARLKVVGKDVRIDFNTNSNWPNVRFIGKWDFSPYAELVGTFKNTSGSPVRLEWRINNPGGTWQKDSRTVRIPLKPGEEKDVHMRLVRKKSSPDAFSFHGMHSILPGFPSQKGIDVSNVTSMEFILPRSGAERSVTIKKIVAKGEYKPFMGKILPLVDKFGQYRHADWPGKIKSYKQMREMTAAQQLDLKNNPGPQEWNKYGGWVDGPQLKATGHFRVEKYKGKWSLVDPSGRLFFSIGVNHVNIAGIHSSTALFRRNGWFKELPSPNSPNNQQFYFVRYIYSGDYSGNYSPGFTFIGYNLYKKYGADWKKTATALAPVRLRSWGINTIANWSDYEVYQTNRLPYTVGTALAGSGARVIGGGKWRVGGIWDVYDPKFKGHVDARVKSLKGISASPWCIGIFFDNELSWGNDFPATVLRSRSGEPAKQAFVKMLKDKYGEIAKLNKQWGTGFAGWEQLSQNRKTPDRKKAGADMDAFYFQTARVYYKTIRDSIRKYCPGKLYLGSRYAASQYSPLVVRAAAEYCDVISFNIYYRSLNGFLLSEKIDAPIMCTEFHFGSKDRGMFGPGLVPVKDQKERAEAYTKYVESALRHPLFVGCHWFQYCDQPVTGRIFDGENANIGFLNVADMPYPELIAASRKVATEMYNIRYK